MKILEEITLKIKNKEELILIVGALFFAVSTSAVHKPEEIELVKSIYTQALEHITPEDLQ